MKTIRVIAPLAIAAGLCLAAPASALNLSGAAAPGIHESDSLIEMAQARGRPGAGRPGVGRPGVGRPGVGRPGVGRPGVGRPPVARPPVARPPIARPPVVRPPIARPRPPAVIIGRPVSRRYWRPGVGWAVGSIAALGFVTAAAAAAWAPPPPGPGYCWFYTDRSRRAGFWDWCP